MRLPFVSRLAYEQVCSERDHLRQQLAEQVVTTGTSLRDALDVMRESRQAPVFPEPPQSPLAALGPLTTRVLQEMASGMPPANRRAMEAKALTLWQQHEGQEKRDELVATAVRRGEPVGR